MKIPDKRALIESLFFKHFKRAPSEEELRRWVHAFPVETTPAEMERVFERELRFEITVSALVLLKMAH
jgi:hypothetical protein